MLKKKSVIPLFTAIAALSADIYAEEPSKGSLPSSSANKDASSNANRLEQVTVIGSRATKNADLGGVSLTKIPVSAFVVSREEIERIRFVDPDDFLDRIPGETQVRNLRIPNGGKPYTIPLVDGMPLDDPYNGATSDINRVNSFDIERIEILKGPASALYGNNAFGGVINVVTRDAPKEAESRVFLELGDFGHRRLGVNSGGSFTESLGYFIDANGLESDGIRDNYQGLNVNNIPSAERNDRVSLSGKLQYRPSDNTDMSLRYEYLDRDEVTATDVPQESFDLDPSLVLANGAGDPDVSFEQAETHALYATAKQTYDSGMLSFAVVARNVESEGDGRFSDPELEDSDSLNFKLWYRHDLGDHNIIIGGERFDGDIETESFDDVAFAVSNGFQYTDLTIDALFVQTVLSANDRVDVTLGLRYENIKTDSSFIGLGEDEGIVGEAEFDDLSPKLGVTFQATENNLLWVGFSKGFLAPAPDDVFDPSEGNTNLKPEDATNIELGLRGEVGKFSYNTSVYHTEIENYLFTEDLGNGEDQTSNAAQVTVEGIESVIEYNISDSWRLGATHTYAKNVFDSFVQSEPGEADDFSGNRLSRSPEHHFNARIAWLPLDGLIVELEGDLYSGYYTDDSNSDPLGKFKRNERIDLRINYAIGDWTLWFNALNLTDTLEDRVSFSTRNQVRSFRLVDGRNFQTGVSYSF